MKRLFNAILSLMVCWGVSTNLMADDPISIEVFAAYAPSASPNPSPSWSSYVTNAIEGLRNGESQVGDRQVDPAAYEVVAGSVTPLEMFYTTFKSWRGLADPNPSFTELGSSFVEETGNRIHFGVHIITDGTVSFSLMDLSWALDSDDDSNWFDQSGNFLQSLYSSTRVGIHYGSDGLRGTADDIIFDGGELGISKVHEFMYLGVGEGFAAFAGDGDDNQAAIANNIRALLAGAGGAAINLTGSYSLVNPLGGEPLFASDTIEIRFPAGMGGDFDFDKRISSTDVDLLTTTIAGGSYDILFDLNLDELVDSADLEIIVHEIGNTYFGDADFDSQFTSSDLIDVLAFGLYETELPAVWSQGDFNADGIFESDDLILALSDGGYENSANAPALVPEPTSLALTLFALTLVALRFPRQRD